MDHTPRKIPVIIDTDPGVDDVLAILLALASPEIEILAFIISFGEQFKFSPDNPPPFETHTRQSKNIPKIYNAIDRHIQSYPEEKDRFPNVYFTRRKPILAMGPKGPLAGPLITAKYFHGRDGLGNISERHPDLDGSPDILSTFLDVTDESGPEVALRLLREHPPRSITYIALGPLTNFAQMLTLDPDTTKNAVGRLVSMGGAVDLPGNTTPVAEFNFYADPFAVHNILMPEDSASGFPLNRFVLLPLDITTQHQLRFSHYTKAVDMEFKTTAAPSKPSEKRPLVHFTSSFLEYTREIMLSFGNDAMELHDVVAVWCALQNPPCVEETDPTGLPTLLSSWRASSRKFNIERAGKLTRGMLVVDRRVDRSAFPSGANRSTNFDAKPINGQLESIPALADIPAPVEISSQKALEANDRTSRPQQTGVACMTETPGCAALVSLMMERIWNVRSDRST